MSDRCSNPDCMSGRVPDEADRAGNVIKTSPCPTCDPDGARREEHYLRISARANGEEGGRPRSTYDLIKVRFPASSKPWKGFVYLAPAGTVKKGDTIRVSPFGNQAKVVKVKRPSLFYSGPIKSVDA